MNEGGQVRTRTEGLKGASRYPVRVGLRDRVDVDHLLKFWVVFGGILFYQRGNTNFSSYPNIRLLDIVTGDLTDVSYQKLTNSRILPLTHFLQSTNQM